jgi:hypothetical protein
MHHLPEKNNLLHLVNKQNMQMANPRHRTYIIVKEGSPLQEAHKKESACLL